MINLNDITITDLIDGALPEAQRNAWLAAHPELADEVVLAQRVRNLLIELRAAQIEVPPDFEARLIKRIHADTTLQHLLDWGLGGVGRALIELLDLIFGLVPAPQPTTS